MSSTIEINEQLKLKTLKNVLKSVSDYQKRNPEKCAEKHANTIEGLRQTPNAMLNIWLGMQIIVR
jgi:hypothetical protein